MFSYCIKCYFNVFEIIFINICNLLTFVASWARKYSSSVLYTNIFSNFCFLHTEVSNVQFAYYTL